MNAAKLCTARDSLVPLAAIALLLWGCGSDLVLPHGNQPAGIRVIEGDGDRGQTGDVVTVVVEVSDDAGLPLEGVDVAFNLTSGGEGADITPTTATTDGAGHALAQMLLGTRAGLQTGDARVVSPNGTQPTTSFSVVVLPAGPGNRAPRSDFEAKCQELSCEFTDKSDDQDGSVTSWQWSFGDGTTSDVREPAHIYSGPGTYTVSLTIADDGGATDVSQNNVTVIGADPLVNQAPHADFDVHCFGSFCSFEDKSQDDDGSIVSWVWDFGDGSATSTEPNPVHLYEDGGKFRVTLIVTDDDGAVDSKTHDADPKDH
ncbi:MAG TPA: PKD domain-containing protein [Gemmatimonadales bacterium]|jgi:PKD repeat protein|nr:PKD domain-containing protein [Gemmatimonadales bacterium]